MKNNPSIVSSLSALALSAALAACASTAKPPPPAPPPPPTRPAPPSVSRGPTGPIPGSERDFVVNVGDRVYFDYDQYTVRTDAIGVLSGEAAWLNRYPMVMVRIEGNCDERGGRPGPGCIPACRASSIRDFMTAHGVSAARITTISYGKEHPMDEGSGEQAWAHNRNGHTAIVSGAR